MPPNLVQCVPNFSEGRDPAVLRSLASALEGRPDVVLADWSADADHHRSVFTLLGKAEAVLPAVLAAAEVAFARIDLSRHQGVHPRLGVLDVLPFVPVGATEMSTCVNLARQAGEALGSHGIPVYLYEEAATSSERRNLARLRNRGFESLRDTPLVGELAPDYGPDRLHPRWGAVCVGARGPLLAYNIVLASGDLAAAQRIARRLRERDGGLPGLRALGLPLEDRGLTQLSFNLTSPRKTTLADVWEAARAAAADEGTALRESELIGALRGDDLIAVARHFLQCPGLQPRQLLETHLPELFLSSSKASVETQPD